MSILWDLHQNARIAQVDAESTARARTSSATANDAVARVEAVERQVDKLLLINAALWELLVARGFREDELVAKMTEIDLRDGRADGKISGTVVTCSACQRTLNGRHDKCLYCGTARAAVGPFGG